MTKKILPVYAAFILLLACSITSQAGTPPTSTKLSPSPTEIPTPLEPTATPWETSIPPSLRNYADFKGIRFGTYFPWQVSSDPNWQTVAGEEFNQANLFDGFSWRDLEPQQEFLISPSATHRWRWPFRWIWKSANTPCFG